MISPSTVVEKLRAVTSLGILRFAAATSGKSLDSRNRSQEHYELLLDEGPTIIKRVNIRGSERQALAVEYSYLDPRLLMLNQHKCFSFACIVINHGLWIAP